MYIYIYIHVLLVYVTVYEKMGDPAKSMEMPFFLYR